MIIITPKEIELIDQALNGNNESREKVVQMINRMKTGQTFTHYLQNKENKTNNVKYNSIPASVLATKDLIENADSMIFKLASRICNAKCDAKVMTAILKG